MLLVSACRGRWCNSDALHDLRECFSTHRRLTSLTFRLDGEKGAQENGWLTYRGRPIRRQMRTRSSNLIEPFGFVLYSTCRYAQITEIPLIAS
jgi:hypothetical protein